MGCVSESGVFLMCKVKEGARVISIADLQNLVTSVILRQTSAFSTQEIFNLTQDKLHGSVFKDSPIVIERCKETISTLYLIDCLKATDSDRYKLSMSFPAVGRL